MKKKIAIVGAGNAGCITALNFGYFGQNLFDIDMYYDPDTPMERVGQGTTPDVLSLISASLDLDWWNNDIGATIKTGILYEKWGKKQEEVYHKFYMDNVAMHFQTHELSRKVRESQYVNVIEKNIIDPEAEIDADYIFDCRGRSGNDYDEYNTLINPLNAVLLCKQGGRDPDLTHTRCVATPDGWTFVVPNHDSVSYGYLYNNNITSKDEATFNMHEIFNVVPDGDLTYRNYIAKSMWKGDRTILNGNKFCFLEPLEATSSAFYKYLAGNAWEHIIDGKPKFMCDHNVSTYMKRVETFVLWHYQFGSAYDTPFWQYAKSLPFEPDVDFRIFSEQSLRTDYPVLNSKQHAKKEYGIWPLVSFKIWHDGMNPTHQHN